MEKNSDLDHNQRPFTVALTGGIASGKTLVSDAFAQLGVPVIDTDIIAHEIVEPGQPALKEIQQTFGADYIDRNGRLKRADLRTRIFSDRKARKQLERILHPRIRKEVKENIDRVNTPYCVLVIPLLADKSTFPYVDRILVVDVDSEIQVERLMKRDNCDRRQALQALAAQPKRQQRLEIADDVLDNSGSPAQAHQKVASLHIKYSQLARAG